ncbi:MAG: DUF1048 domain-containing protein [Bacilli bacterium]
MLDKFVKLVIGDIDDKRAYKNMMKRVDNLPKDYQFAFKKIQHYIYTVGNFNSDITIFEELIELFEASAVDGRQVLDVIGSDVSKFSDEFISVSNTNIETLREKLNKDVMQRFIKGDKK